MTRLTAMALAIVLATIAPVNAADLAKIDRTIAKEPVYKNKPKYCLFVFGPEAAFRVWTVLDGDVLYVDRNGNGDLTDEDEKILPQKSEQPNSQNLSFTVKSLSDGTLVHNNLRMSVVKKTDQTCTIDMYVEVQLPGFQGGATDGRVEHTAGADPSGTLAFADSPKDASIVHFGGPLQLELIEKQTLKVNRGHDLRLGIGTIGVGVGSFGFIGEGQVIPKGAFPKVEITFAAKDGQPPAKTLYELKERC